ncbi:hypothetical protein NYO67_4618 [Aspergillus flavus]|nr:hypothetical protein NYO67_4618 [Aspergillus flavus]
MDQATEEYHPRKRIRIPVACRSCRNRKSRCDGGRPSCLRCTTVGDTCIYEQPSSSSISHHLRPGSQLLCRLEAIEEKLVSISSTSSTLVLPPASPPIESGYPSRSSFRAEMPRPGAEQPPTSTHKDLVDGMGTIRLAPGGENAAYFGATSNIALLKHITTTLTSLPRVSASVDTPEKQCGSLLQTADLECQPQSGISWFWPVTADLTSLDLPPDPEGINMIHEYFNTVGLCLPIIHEDTFIATYQQARRDGFKNFRRPLLALLYMVFAHVKLSRTAVSPCEDEIAASEKYFQKALTLAVPDAILDTGLEIVQLLCSMCCYLHGSSSSSQVWTFHSLAVKAGVQLGLHSGCTPSELSPLQHEMRKRTWYCCSSQRCFWSTASDREFYVESKFFIRYRQHLPPGQQKLHSGVSESVQLPSLIVATISKSVHGDGDANSSRLLSDIVFDIVHRLYNNNANAGSPKTLSLSETLVQGFSLSRRLSEWCDAVPLDLRPGNAFERQYSRPPNLEAQRLRNILSFRYFGTSILVHRPLFSRFLDFIVEDSDSGEDRTLLQGLGAFFLKECLDVCCRIISLTRHIVDEFSRETTLLGAWWYTTYYTFNASLMLLGGLLISRDPRLMDAFPSETVRTWRSYLEDAVELLASVSNGRKSIMRCCDCLKALLDDYDSMPNHPAGLSSSFWSQAGIPRLNLASTRSATATEENELHSSRTGMSSRQVHPFATELDFDSLGAFLAGPDLASLNGL